MPLETGTYISDLNVSNPLSSDDSKQGDDHLRLIKGTIKNTFPNITGAITPTHTELNYVDGATSNIQAQLDSLSSGAYDPRTKPVFSTDFFSLANNLPFVGAFISGVTSPTIVASSENHVGLVNFDTPTSPYFFLTPSSSVFPQANNKFEVVFYPTTAGTLRLGFLNTLTNTAPTVGAWIEFSGSLQPLAKTSDGGTVTTSAFLTIPAATWYRAVITANSTNTSYLFEIYNASTGVLVESKTITATLPTSVLHAGLLVSTSRFIFDYMAVSFGGTTGLSR